MLSGHGMTGILASLSIKEQAQKRLEIAYQKSLTGSASLANAGTKFIHRQSVYL
jgi:hypothetical protein